MVYVWTIKKILVAVQYCPVFRAVFLCSKTEARLHTLTISLHITYQLIVQLNEAVEFIYTFLSVRVIQISIAVL